MEMFRSVFAVAPLLLFSGIGLWASSGSAPSLGGPFQLRLQNPGQTLEPGSRLERELAPDETHSYRVTLTSGQFFSGVIDQTGIDVALRVFGPDGRQLCEINNATTAVDTERFCFVANSSGDYRIEVRPAESDLPSGRYRIGIKDLRDARPQDIILASAEEIYSEAQALRRQSQADSQRKAVARFKEALPVWEQLNDKAGEARTQIAIGEICANLSENEEALDWYTRALSNDRLTSDRRGEAIALTDIGGIYYALGDKQKALQYYDQALPLHRAEENHSGIGRTVGKSGLAYWSMGDYQKALEYLESALKECRIAGDRFEEANTLQITGLVYNSFGENPKALEHYGGALTIQRAIGDRQGMASTLMLTGLVHGSTSEHQKALASYDEALAIDRDVGDRRGEGQTLNYIGQVYYTLGEFQNALDWYERSLLVRRTAGDRAGQGITLNNIGTVYRALGDGQRALDFYDQSLQLRIAVSDRSGQSITLSNIAQVYRSLGDSNKALEYYNRALEIQRTVRNPLVESNILNSIGGLYESLGDDQKALGCYSQSLRLKQSIEDRIGGITTLIKIAETERRMGDTQGALARTEAAVGLLESVRAKMVGPGIRSSFFASNHNVYELYIDLLMQSARDKSSREQVTTALLASERARARVLLDTLLESGGDIRQGIDPLLLEKERALQRELNRSAEQITRLLNGKHTDEQETAARKRLDSTLVDYERVESQIRIKSPRFAALTQAKEPALKEIQETLDSQSLLLEYALGDERSYLWAVTPNSITAFELPKRAIVETAARRFYDSLTAHNKPAKDEMHQQRLTRIADADSESRASAAELSRMLLGPVATQLGSKRLVIVSEGALQYIPFAALPVPKNGADVSQVAANKIAKQPGAAQPSPLILDHEIINLPSVGVLAALRRELAERKPAPKMVAVIADPVYADEDPRIERGHTQTKTVLHTPTTIVSQRVSTRDIDRSASESGVSAFRRLRFSREEADAITALTPATASLKAVDFGASLETARSADLSGYRFVHLATHGLLDSRHPELSGLVLSLFDEQGQPQEGFLRVHEIYNLKLNADLVVLSACQTALGKEIRGEGLVGLTRGFMYAGAARVVASLWSVEDRATAELMKRFYRGMLTERMRPAAALRAAQISLLVEKGWESPYYWAAFTLQGEWK